MAKKKAATESRDLEKAILVMFSDQLDNGCARDGYTYDEARAELELESGGEEWNRVVPAMVWLRDAGFLGHRFTNSTRFVGDPLEIPNLHKRGERVRQLVFFLSERSVHNMGGENGLADFVDTGLPEAECSEPTIFRSSVVEFYESLAQVIDDSVTDANYHAMATLHIQALVPSEW